MQKAAIQEKEIQPQQAGESYIICSSLVWTPVRADYIVLLQNKKSSFSLYFPV